MKNNLLSSVLSLMVTLPMMGQAQIPNSSPLGKNNSDKKWMISLTYGQSLVSPGKDLEKAMTACGFNDRTPIVTYLNSIFGINFGTITTGGEQYTQRKDNNEYLDVHLTYSVTPKSSLAVHCTTGPGTVVKGYDHHNQAENFLTLKTKSTLFSMEYIFHAGPRHSGLSIGPILAFHEVAQETNNSSQEEYHQNSVVPGVHMGYELGIVNSKAWFIGLNANYNWFTKVQVGEIKVGDPNVYTSVFKPTAISLDNINLGLTLGIKI